MQKSGTGLVRLKRTSAGDTAPQPEKPTEAAKPAQVSNLSDEQRLLASSDADFQRELALRLKVSLFLYIFILTPL